MIMGGRLVIPGELPRVGLYRQNTGRVQLIAVGGTQLFRVIGGGIGGAEVDEVERGVIRETVPCGCTQLVLGTPSRIPGFGGGLHGGGFRRMSPPPRRRGDAPPLFAPVPGLTRELTTHP